MAHSEWEHGLSRWVSWIAGICAFVIHPLARAVHLIHPFNPLSNPLSVLLLGVLLLAGCTSVRPTLKVGLLAPFEGLHRRSGYAALAAVRAAVADFPYAEAGVLPLALDDGGQPQGAQRAAQKLLADGRVAAVVGPLIYKFVTKYTTIEQGPIAFVLFESLVMVTVWSLFYAVKKPIPASVLFSKESLKGGAMVGAAMTMVSLSKFAAMHYVDNPGLVPAVKYIDAIIVMAYYRAIGKVEKADVVAGLGIVGCAVAIILLRSF